MLSYLPFGKSKSKADDVKKEAAEQKSPKPAPASTSPPPAAPTGPTDPVAEATPATSEPATIPSSPAKKEAEQLMSPVLSPHDEKFLQARLEESAEEPPVVILEGDSGTTTPQPELAESEKKEETKEEEKEEEKEEKLTEEEKAKKKSLTDDWKSGLQTRWTGLRRTVSSATEKRRAKSKSKSPGPSKKDKGKDKEQVEPVKEDNAKVDKGKEVATEKKEEEKTDEEKQTEELTAALDRLNLAAEDGRAFSLSKETKELLDRFTQILKDLVNGVPTAYDDLTNFLDSSSKQLEQIFTSLPSFLQKLVATLPNKMTKNISPDLLRTFAAAAPAAAAQGEKLAVPTLKELVTKPGMVLGLLKSVVNVLKTRFPALMGANLALSLGLTVLLLVLWYCYKRGKEERLSKEMEEVERKVREIEKERELEEAAKQVPAGSPEPVVMEPQGKMA